MQFNNKNTELEKDTSTDKQSEWLKIETSGKDRPSKISHHTCIVYGDKMYLFGGS